MSASSRNYWRTLEELAETPEFGAIVEQEVPRFREVLGQFDRRQFLQLMAASMALGGLSACGPEPNARQLLPYVVQPPGIVPQQSRFYATATTRDGYASGVLVTHQMGRPFKVEGNPQHPASLGAASAIMQASILTLYDPRRSQSIVGHGQIDTWERFITVMFERRQQLLARGGEGLRVLTGTVTSPSLIAQMETLQRQFPNMQWHGWEPLHPDEERAATRQAFGRELDRVFNVDAADVIFAVESDLISAIPGWLAYARQFAARRRPDETGGKMSRVYAIESTPTLIGAKADHRLPLPPPELAAALRYLAAAVGVGPQEWKHAPPKDAAWLDAAAQDLAKNHGRVLVHAGREQPAEIHLLADAINGALGAFGTTIRLIEPIAVAAPSMRQSLTDLVGDMIAGKVDTLLMLGVNPVYTAPPGLDFAKALRQVPLSVSLALYADETAIASTWHVPAAHEYEAWSDARAFDGTITIQQPQVRRLYGGHSAQEVLAILQGNTLPEDYGLLRAFWQQQAQQRGAGDFEHFWHESVRIGVVENSAAAPVTAQPKADVAAIPAVPAEPPNAGLALLFRPDPLIWDGHYADNPWLLEMARPFTRLTWDNAALIAPATAKRLGLDTEDVLEIMSNGRKLSTPIFVLPGQAPDCITLPLGWGRRAGGLAVGVGFDAYQLRSLETPWVGAGVLSKTGETYRLATTQGQDRVTGRDLIREGSLADFQKNPQFLQKKENDESLYPPYKYPRYAWAMSVDLNSCIGCQACAVACQAENNVPIVGKDQVLDNRVMHWLRIDRYYSGSPDDPQTSFEPMPCMHCENAPCEVVCPVHATVHDHSGLNVMVYNRCVGTRFCSNNCPYKVRRFNFYAYADQNERPAESWNPEVTVRGRGVMEKCTYCIQRIRQAEIDADKENRLVREGEIVTACQQSCPTQAIIFGNRNDHDSAVARRKASPLDYVLLGDLNTRPRTSYTAVIRNPNPAIGDNEA